MSFVEAMKLGKQMADLKANHPDAWTAGEEFGAEWLAQRDISQVQALRAWSEVQLNEFIDDAASSTAMVFGEAVSAGEIVLGEPVTKETLMAFGISFGTALRDTIDRERRQS